MNRTLVIIPTYNEAKNIGMLISAINEAADIDILIVDDNSPDKTYEIIESLMSTHSNLNLIKREKKLGLGTAYIAGFKFALEKGYSYIMEMDADFSHDPKEIPNFLKEIPNSDLVIGSRYITGVNVINWPMSRLLLSYSAGKYVHYVTGLPVKDPTGGYKCFRRDVLKSIDLDKVRSTGYSFQIEMNHKAWKKGFRLKEIPIVFTDRYMGKTKMTKSIMWEAIWIVWKLRLGII
ncbi:MAG: polyprenol monophosphomannose synthase [Nitrospirae bacterium]|nr:polyprenol monophosphomannose synthase [Nitrospirota bacterium]